MRRWSALLVAVFSSTACSLVVSTNGLSGGTVDGGPNASNDGSLGDGTQGDGGTGSGFDASTFFPTDAATSPCTTQHVFCDDFDTGDPAGLATRWSSIRQNAGPLSLDTTLFASPPRALHMVVQPGAGTRISELRKSVATTTPIVHIELDMSSSGPGTGTWNEVDPLEIVLNPPPAGGDYHVVDIAKYPGVMQFEYAVTSGSQTPVYRAAEITLPTGKWVHVGVTFDFAASPHTAVLVLDGVPAAQLMVGGTTLSGIEIALGATYTEKAQIDETFGFDNVVVE